MATAASMCKPYASASAQARSWKPGRRRQGCGRLANANPVRDERIANLEQRGPRSGDARMRFVYYPFASMLAFCQARTVGISYLTLHRELGWKNSAFSLGDCPQLERKKENESSSSRHLELSRHQVCGTAFRWAHAHGRLQQRR